jgi:hypothetical protein
MMSGQRRVPDVAFDGRHSDGVIDGMVVVTQGPTDAIQLYKIQPRYQQTETHNKKGATVAAS